MSIGQCCEVTKVVCACVRVLRVVGVCCGTITLIPAVHSLLDGALQ